MNKQLLNLNTIQKITLILTTLLLLPMSSLATIYTTTGSPQTVTSDNETFYTWGVSSSEVGWEIRQNAASLGTITTSNDGASIICSNGCRIENFSLPANSSEYVWKIVIEGLTNNENVTATCSNESQYAFTPTSTPGVFVLTQPFSLSGGAQFRILIANKECTITNISVYTTTTNYNVSVAGIPVVGENNTNIFGDDNISVSFTPAIIPIDNPGGTTTPATLTLKNATITPEQEAPGIDYMGSSDLTIKLKGDNRIQGYGGCEAIRYNGVSQTTPNLYFVKDGTQHCSLELIAEVGKNKISGFHTNYDEHTFFVYDEDGNGANTHSTIYSTTILGGTGSAGEPHIIASANDLKKFIEYYNDGRLLSNANVRLEENINCSGVTGFSQLADNTDATFRGLFDGNNKTISNLTLMGSGLFGYIEGGTVKDLTLSNYNLTGNDYPTGGIVAELSNNATISNCTITNSTIACAGNQYNPEVGGIAARMSGSTITGCIIDNVQVKAETTYTGGSGAYSNAGGIVARASSGTISSCIVTNGSKITNYYADESATLKAGAIVGSLNETTLTQNKYDYDVTVEHLNGTNTNNKTIKSDYTQRGTGEERKISDVSYYDVFEDNGAVLANTKTVTLPSNLGDKGEVEIEEGNYYNKDGDNYQIAVGKNVVVRVGAYEPFSIAAFTVSNTSETSFDEIGDGFREYTFVMPDADVTVAVNFAINISSEDYVATIASVTYNGASQVPASVTLTAQDGEEMVLTNSADSNDFTIKSYKINNETATSPIDAGTYTVTIEGIGNYTGTKDAEYVINKAKFCDVDIESIADQTYTGNEIMPAVKVTFNSHPVSAEEYDSVYTANINAGEATITLTSTGKNFVADAQKTKNFTISSKALTEATITLLETSFTYDGNAKNPTITIGFVTGASDAGGSSMITLTESTDYEVTYKKVTGETEESIEPNQVIDSGTYKVIATGKGNYSGTKEAEFTISNGTMDVSVIGYTGTYDTQAHGVTVSAPEGVAIKYGTTEGTYTLDASPEYTDAGSYTVYYQVTRANYQTVTGSVTVEISKADVSITYNEEGYTATYGETFNAPTPTTNPEGLTVTATSSSNTQVATVADGVVTIAGVGETNITVSFAGNSNYNATTATYKLTVGAASMEIIGTGYSGTYDSKAHGITVSAPEGAAIKYGTAEGTYELNASPEYTDAGNNTVYYQVTMNNYNTVTGSATVEITKANITPTVTLEGWTYGTTANTPSITGNAGNGEVTYTYQAEGAETFTEAKPVVVGTHTVKASIAETTNYNAGEATATFAITAATMDVTAEGYKGTYDNEAHGITVTAPEGSTVKYGTQEGTYNLTNSLTYTDAGNYTVYYQVSMDNYTATTGSATVEISKANITPTVTLEGWTYGTTAKTPNIAGNSGNGNVTYTYKAEGAETFVETAPETAGNYTIKASIAETANYNAGEATTEFTITAATMTVTAEGYSDTYDGKAHGITVSAPEDATVMYGTQEGKYDLTESPTYTDADTYIVYYQVTMDNYNTFTGSATVDISKADITPTVSLEGWTYGTTAKSPSVTGNTGEGTVTYTYQAEGAETFGETAPEIVGTHTIKALIAETTNYNAGEATATFTITAATMNVTAEGYEGTYDTQAHGIKVTAPEDATVKYGSQEGTYNLQNSPTYTDAGTYNVYYQVTMSNYTTVTGSKTVEISKANITPTVALEGWTYGTTANTPSITGNTGNGTVTYTYKAEGTETFVDTKPEVVGTHTIKASIAESTNYNAGEATAEFTITAATSSVTAKGYKGAYDKQAHGITVTAPEGSTVMYGTQEGTYEQSESPTYTNAGNYTVYYQVTKENYTTVTGSVTIEISKADITPTVTLEGWTYGTTAKTPSITGNTGEGTVTYTYKAEGADAFGETAPEVVGTHTVKASIAETTNYNAGEATATFTITAATMTVSAAGHEGTYDNKAHGITVTAPEGSKVMYGSQNGTYNLTEAPTYTDAGTYEVYYQVTMNNYTTVTGSETVKISKAAITPTVTLEGWTYGTTAKTPSITGNTGEGTVTYSYKAEGTESFVETMPLVVGTHTVKASIAETTNYNAGEATTTFTITAATMTVTAAGHEGTYDNKAHGITVTAPEGATVKYGSQKGTYNLTESPTYTDAGTYKVHYQVTMDNYSTITDSATVEISKADITPTVTLEGWIYGTTANTPSITGNTGNGNVIYTYKAEGAEEFTENMPEVVGTHTIKASIAETTTYNAGEATATFTITEATATVTAKGYRGAYDNQPHGISVTAPDGAIVMYGTQKGKYELTESPTYTDAGTYKVHYQVTMENYSTITDSATVEISKADITPTVTLEGWTYGTTAKSPSITGNTGNGNVTYTYKAEGADEFTENMPEIVGTHTIKASIAETTNYNAGEATATFTITAATMTVTAKGYEGTYDGNAHGITVTAPEDATIKYGTAEGSYELNASPEYTTAGNYTVYYQVTMDNYATVTGSETVKISKAEAELEFDVPEESKVYATIGKEFTEPTLNNLKGLDVTFSSSDESVATVDKNTGKVTLKSAGLTYITATFAGDDNYNEFAVKYELRVKGSYNLWIDNVQVTSDNYNDILENQKFFYDLVNKWLIITNNETPVTVKSSMPELTIYLNGKSELERIYFDNQGNAQNTGTLSFFNYNDVPGKLTLDTNNDNGVISGFSSICFDDNTKLRFIDPDSCEYKDGLVKMTKPSQLGEIVKQVTIGQYIEPMANGDGISFGNIDSETNITNMTIEDKLLITATQHEEGSNEDDDYIDPNNGAFVMNTTNTSEDVEVLSQGVEDGTKTPGSEDYADSFRGGITFMIPSGTGTIELELMNEEGYMLMLKIGTGVPHEIVRYERATVVIDYNVDEPTYVYLYLEEKSIIGARRAGNNTRVGKRDKAHGTVFSVKVKAASVSSTNPLNNVEGATGNITIPDVNTTTPSGDDVPTKAEFKISNDENKANDDKWYTIDGQRINKPTQKGVYIRNRKKVVVK